MAVAVRGSVVLSAAGHDSGIYHTVLRVDTDGWLYIADGKLRTLTKPKRKNPLHVKVLGSVLCEEQLTTDRAIRNALHPYNHPDSKPR